MSRAWRASATLSGLISLIWGEDSHGLSTVLYERVEVMVVELGIVGEECWQYTLDAE